MPKFPIKERNTGKKVLITLDSAQIKKIEKSNFTFKYDGKEKTFSNRVSSRISRNPKRVPKSQCISLIKFLFPKTKKVSLYKKSIIFKNGDTLDFRKSNVVFKVGYYIITPVSSRLPKKAAIYEQEGKYIVKPYNLVTKKRDYLGYFKTKKEAEEVYQNWKKNSEIGSFTKKKKVDCFRYGGVEKPYDYFFVNYDNHKITRKTKNLIKYFDWFYDKKTKNICTVIKNEKLSIQTFLYKYYKNNNKDPIKNIKFKDHNKKNLQLNNLIL